MDKKQIEDVMLEALGRPDSGQVRDVVPLLAAAVASALNPKQETENRVVKPAETR